MKTVSIGFSAIEGAKAGQLQGRHGKGGAGTPADRDFLSLLAASNTRLGAALDRAPTDPPARAAPFRAGLADTAAGNDDTAVISDEVANDTGDAVATALVGHDVTEVTADADADATDTVIDGSHRTRGDGPRDKDACRHSEGGKAHGATSAQELPRFAGHGIEDIEDAPLATDPAEPAGGEELHAVAATPVEAHDRHDRKAAHDANEVPAAPTGPADAVRTVAADRPELAPVTDKLGETRGNRAPALAHAEAMATTAGADMPPAGLQHAASLPTQTRGQGGEAVRGEADAVAPAAVKSVPTGPQHSAPAHAHAGATQFAAGDTDTGNAVSPADTPERPVARPALRADTRTARVTTAMSPTPGDTAAEPAKLPDAASPVARDVSATGQFTTPSGQHQAPGHDAAGVNAQSLVTAIRHNGAWSKMLGDPVARFTQRTGPGGVNMDVLKIDLHPASLGRMEASLKAQGDRMSITITVSSRDAAASIGNDIAGIQAGLRAAGYTVDQVSVEVRGQSGHQAGWTASQQDTSAGGFARGGGRQQQTEASDNGFASVRSGRTGDETVRSPGSAYVI